MVAISVLALAGAARAVTTAQPGSGDPHIQSVDYDPQQLVVLQVAAGFALTVEFSPDERIENVAVGNGAVWQVTPNKSADRIFIKSIPGSSVTNMTVVTDARTYAFELQPLMSPDRTTPYIVRFNYAKKANTAEAVVDPAQHSAFSYKFSGAKILFPSEMWDNGQFTYITWGGKTSVAAIYVIDAQGDEALVNGGLRDGRYVVEQVANNFIFRLGADEARAQRRPVKVRKNDRKHR